MVPILFAVAFAVTFAAVAVTFAAVAVTFVAVAVTFTAAAVAVVAGALVVVVVVCAGVLLVHPAISTAASTRMAAIHISSARNLFTIYNNHTELGSRTLQYFFL